MATSPFRFLFTLFSTLATLGMLVETAPAAQTGAAPLEKALRKHSAQITKALSQRGYQNVGVLPFMVQYGEDRESYRGSPINANLADFVASALVLAQDSDSQKSKTALRVIIHAGKTAVETLGSANPRTLAGRKELFNVNYQLHLPTAPKVKADAFLYGKLWIAKDYSDANVAIYVFDAARLNPQPVASFPVQLNAKLLAELGESFTVSSRGNLRLSRGPNDLGDFEITSTGDVLELPDTNADGGETTEFPVKLTAYYNDRKQILQADPYGNHNFFTMPDPKEGERVVFDVENLTDEVLGVVLAVNGVNTLYREQGDPTKFAKWILAPKTKYRIHGWWIDSKQAPLAIIGASDAESQRKYDELGPEHAGQIGMWVYRKSSGESELGSPMASRDNGSLHRLPLASRLKVSDIDDLAGLINQQAGAKPARGMMVEGDSVTADPLKIDEFGAGHLIGHMQVKYYSAAQSSSGQSQEQIDKVDQLLGLDSGAGSDNGSNP